MARIRAHGERSVGWSHLRPNTASEGIYVALSPYRPTFWGRAVVG
jgi:hypothetical protein